MELLIVTNNPRVVCRLGNSIKVEFFDVSYRQVLVIVRDRLHMGHKLLTHPLSGSVKPNETPYKSVMISDSPAKPRPGSGEFAQNIKIIEDSIIAYDKFDKRKIDYSEKLLDDFMLIDCEIIASALQ